MELTPGPVCPHYTTLPSTFRYMKGSYKGHKGGYMPCHFWSSLAFWFDRRGSDGELHQNTVLETVSGLIPGKFSCSALWSYPPVGVQATLDEEW